VRVREREGELEERERLKKGENERKERKNEREEREAKVVKTQSGGKYCERAFLVVLILRLKQK